ncbi:MAG: Bug family tripartite tricarboxylate transporter substrate binding protein [Hyphomicrobiaceae bacterium]
MRFHYAGGIAASLLVGAGAMALATMARADDASDFFKDKQLTWIVSYGPGGSYGLYAQLAARHIVNHLPGKPNIVVQFMPGAGGITATNHLYNLAPKDGSTIATVTKDLALEQALRPKNVRYDARKFSWVGSFAEYIAVFAVWKASGVTSIEDAKKREVVLATSGRGHQGSQLAVLLNDFAGTKFKLVTGYRGAADMNIAMERGEAQTRISSWSGFKSQQGAWLKDGKAAIIAQGGDKRQADLPNVPLFSELVTDPEGRKLLAIIESGAVVGWPALMPPGVPADRLAVWRKAFDATMKDPAFVAEVTKAKLEILPKSGAELAKVIGEVLSADEKLLARARTIAGIKN